MTREKKHTNLLQSLQAFTQTVPTGKMVGEVRLGWLYFGGVRQRAKNNKTRMKIERERKRENGRSGERKKCMNEVQVLCRGGGRGARGVRAG